MTASDRQTHLDYLAQLKSAAEFASQTAASPGVTDPAERAQLEADAEAAWGSYYETRAGTQ